MTDIDDDDRTQPREEPRAALEEALYEIKRVIVGQDAMLERLLVACSPAATCCSRACPAWPRR